MKATKYLIYAVMVVAAPLLGGCGSNDEFDFSKNYDIPWVVSTITSVSPLEGVPGTSVTIGGENLGADFVPGTGIKFGTEICTIVSQTATSVTVTVPNLASAEAVEISVTNLHNRKFVFESKFTPVLE
ncbi:IPT/TIG domain-containing protein [uncultured Bacteroides sp.]|uniref:IPT/TIG domain-containing protein n=1 Tax=uncultured Bacteroides sp. TaxID=162156 RepID=UPI002AA6A9ED|nr:IPT/TIG domain-containing protein [uncultured Bacteroides sp.]